MRSCERVAATRIVSSWRLRIRDVRATAAAPGLVPYAVTRDGQRFILPVPVEARNPESTTVVLNWPSDVER